MQVSKLGDWAQAMRVLSGACNNTAKALRRSVLQEAQHLRTLIVQGITQQAPGNEPLRPITKLTAASRRLKRFLGTKALLVHADLRNSIAVVGKGDTAFVGVLRQARGRDNRRLVDVAAVQEFGAGPTIIPITPAMRRYLHVLLREAGIAPMRTVGRKQVVVLIIPPRPFLRPAGGLFFKGLRERFRKRLASQLERGDA